MKKDNSEALEQYREMVKESQTALKAFMNEAKNAIDAYSGRLLSDEVKQALREKGIPPIEVNLCEKPVNVVQGYYSQIMGDVGVYPVEIADNRSASILSQAIKWNMLHKNIRDEILAAVKASCITGIGFIELGMNYENDIVNGDITAEYVRYSQVLWDPLAVKPTLSDAEYIIKRTFMQRREIADMYEDYADEIMEMKIRDSDETDLANITLENKRRNSEYMVVDEVWYKDYTKKALVVFTEPGPDGQPISQRVMINDYKTSDKKKIEESGGTILGIKLVRSIHKMVVVNFELVVYDEPQPDYEEFPIVPFMYNYTPDAEDWADKLRGIVKTIKPHNDEINRRKSQMMAVTLQQPISGHYVEESSIVSLEDFTQRSGPGRIIRYRGIQPQPIRGDFSALTALINLDQMARQDIYDSGPNPDLLGGIGGSGPSAPGITIQTRQKTALTAMQAAFDNFNRSLKAVGRIMVNLMLKNWDIEKFDRICDSEIPPEFESIRETAVYDIIVDEKVNDKLYQLSVFSSLLELAKMGFQIDPMLLLDYSGIDQSAKERQLQYMQAQMQQMPPGGMPNGGM